MGPSDEESDSNPYPEDEEFHQVPDAADSMEEAIGKFMEGLEGQERASFNQMHRLLHMPKRSFHSFNLNPKVCQPFLNISRQ
jgi:hypothetical protein